LVAAVPEVAATLGFGQEEETRSPSAKLGHVSDGAGLVAQVEAQYAPTGLEEGHEDDSEGVLTGREVAVVDTNGPRPRFFRWLWLPSGCADPRLGFPARHKEVRQHLNNPHAPPHKLLRRIHCPTSQVRSYAEVLKVGGYDDGRKRRLEAEGGAHRLPASSGGRRQDGVGEEARGRFVDRGGNNGGGYRYREKVPSV
jgi:hypothetical protein